MRRAREREEADRLDLEILDPLTGEPLDADAVPTDRVDSRHRPQRVSRLRRLALVLAVFSVACAAGAGVRASEVWSLRALDRRWAEAMALDRARQQADDDLRAAVVRTGGATGRERDEAYREALDAIGRETTARLLAIEEDLARQRVLDDDVAAVRASMLDGLRFRRRQLSVERGLLGSTPLQRADRALRDQLERYGLGPTEAAVPQLRSAAAALESVERFAPSDTAALLVASSGRRLLHIDVDANRVDDRTLPRPPVRLLAVDDLVIVADGLTVTAYPRRHDRPAMWSVPGSAAVAGREGSTVAAWVSELGAVRPVAADGTIGPSVRLPPLGAVLADTDGGLLVERGGSLHLHDRESGAVVRALVPAGRFAGATAGFVAVQAVGRPSLTLHRLADASTFTLDLPRTDAGPIVQAPEEEVLAFAAGPLAGNIASLLRLQFVGNEWSLVGMRGPRATVLERSVVWSPSGNHLFWLTPEGRVAYASTGRPAGMLRAPVEGLEQLVALPRQG